MQAAIASVPPAQGPAPRELHPSGEGRSSRSRSRGRAKKPISSPDEWSAIIAAINPPPGSEGTKMFSVVVIAASAMVLFYLYMMKKSGVLR